MRARFELLFVVLLSGCTGVVVGPPGSGGGAGAGGGSSPYLGEDTGAVDDVLTALPELPQIEGVIATQRDDSVFVTFEPVEGAVDYRVYELPGDGDIHVDGSGHISIENATYRCAGTRETPPPALESAANDPTNWVVTHVEHDVSGYPRTLADATLGHVYLTPGDGRVPVYVLGESAPSADQSCGYSRWAATRVKLYTTSASQRAQALAEFARDDGIAFYVPAQASAATRLVYRSDDGQSARYYVPEGPEADARASKTAAFSVLEEPAPGTKPLMRVFYENRCGWSHDELAVGQERFSRIYHQGDKLPLWKLMWTGVTKPTTLVVEALDGGCPHQGHLAPVARDARQDVYGNIVNHHPAWVTLSDVRAASPHGEVFINGQYDGVPHPNAIARAFVNVAPAPLPSMDFLATFTPGTPDEIFTQVVPTPGVNCGIAHEADSPTFNVNVICPLVNDEGLQFAMRPVMGELWVNYADAGGDTNGKFRLTPHQTATLSQDAFLHVTMEVTAYSTARRYPQIIISEAGPPVQSNLHLGRALVVQPRAGTSPWYDYPVFYELQVCNQRFWDVNDQCPQYDLRDMRDGNGAATHIAPNHELGESANADYRARFDVYASTERAYLFFEGKPYGCAILPDVGVPSGEVFVTWGDTLYHSGVDHVFDFHRRHLQVETRRHFDNLGFSSGVAAPAWDEARFPCVPPITP